MLVILAAISAAWLFTAYDWAKKVSKLNDEVVRQINAKLSDHEMRLAEMSVASSSHARELLDTKKRATEQAEQTRVLVSSLEIRKMEIMGLANHLGVENVIESNAVKNCFFLFFYSTMSRVGSTIS